VEIAQGFIGQTESGIDTTIGRGGSDHTGALIGAALGSREIQIWTDVSGILTADPRVVAAARVVPEVTFTEARELAYFGAKVIHPDTILPAVARAIPVVIKNSMRPDDGGTRILPDGSSVPAGIHSITVKRGMTSIRLSPKDPREGPATTERALALFEQHGVPLYCALLAESRATAVVQTEMLDDVVTTSLEMLCHAEAAPNRALLCLCGSELGASSHDLASAIDALGGIPIELMASGISAHTLLVGVPEERASEALVAMHERLFEG
jgi:aspartate kinase